MVTLFVFTVFYNETSKILLPMASGAIWPPSLPAESHKTSPERAKGSPSWPVELHQTSTRNLSHEIPPRIGQKLTQPGGPCQDTSTKIPQPRFCDQHPSSPDYLAKISGAIWPTSLPAESHKTSARMANGSPSWLVELQKTPTRGPQP